MLTLAVLTTFFIGSEDERIVGGQDATPGEFPYQVTLLYNSNLMCGGTLINESWVLSAAHCCFGREFEPLSAVMGNHKLNAVDSGEQTININKYFVHPAYNYNTIENDICLLRLAKKATLGNYVRTINLPQKQQEYQPNTVCNCTGWGTTSEGGAISNILQKVQLKVVSANTCKQQYTPEAIVNTMMCAADSGKDSCQGDSGGPLVCKSGEVSGIVSWGYGCAQAGYSGVYTKTSYYINWINETITNNPNSSSLAKVSYLVFILAALLLL